MMSIAFYSALAKNDLIVSGSGTGRIVFVSTHTIFAAPSAYLAWFIQIS